MDEYKQRAMQRWPGVAWTVLDFGVKAAFELGYPIHGIEYLSLAPGGEP